MADLRAVAVQAAKANGLDPRIFLAQIQQESGFNPNARSGAGAIGIAQIVPKWHPGVDATDPVASLNYAAHWMGQLVKKYGNYQQALSVYNSGDPNAYKDPGFAKGQTYNYVRSITGGSATPLPASTALPGLTPPPTLGGGNRLLAGLQGIDKQLGLGSIKWPTAPSLPGLATSTLPFTAGTPVPVSTMPLQAGQTGKWVNLSSTADRAGVNLHPQVFNFVAQVAQVFGKPLTIGTGTNHNQYVAGSTRQSDHWTGWAADIPASGATLTQLGQDALVAAGANPQWARQQKGGLYNIGGKQIIFNSMIGGNHFNHLHVGIRR